MNDLRLNLSMVIDNLNDFFIVLKSSDLLENNLQVSKFYQNFGMLFNKLI